MTLGAVLGERAVLDRRDRLAREQLITREQEAREKVTSILESITDAFFAVDLDWRFTYVNREAERLLNRSRAALLGQSLWDKYSDAIGSNFQQQYRRAVQDQVTVRFEDYYAPLDIWLDVRAYPSPGGLSVFFRDVSRRKRAEETLRESEERFRALAENATVGIFVGLASWNDFLLPMLMTQSTGMRTLPLGLIHFVQSGLIAQEEHRFALIVMMTLPVIVIFVLLQRQFVRGLTAGAVKS